MVEVDRLHSHPIRGGQEDQLDVSRVASHVPLEPAVGQQRQRLDTCLKRTARRANEGPVRGLCREDEDALAAAWAKTTSQVSSVTSRAREPALCIDRRTEYPGPAR